MRRLQMMMVWLGTSSVFPLVAEAPVQPLTFFDYLGELVEHEGEWLDPLTMDNLAPLAQADSTAGTDKASLDPAADEKSKAEEVTP